MPNIKLKGQTGEVLTYEDVERVYFDSADKDGEVVYYTHGKVLEGVTIEPNFSKGDQVISVPDGSLVKEATIVKPAELTPENIRAGKNVAGVVGELIGDAEEVTVDLSMAEGGQVITPSAATKVLSKVTITKPGTMQPENIKAGVNIGGVVGEFSGDTEEVIVDLDFSEGDQVIEPSAVGKSIVKATVTKPETLIPENIRKNIGVGGVFGSFVGDTEEATVNLDFTSGNQIVLPSAENKVFSKVTITQPEALVPENIAENINIAGVVGTFVGGNKAVSAYTKKMLLSLTPNNEQQTKTLLAASNLPDWWPAVGSMPAYAYTAVNPLYMVYLIGESVTKTGSYYVQAAKLDNFTGYPTSNASNGYLAVTTSSPRNGFSTVSSSYWNYSPTSGYTGLYQNSSGICWGSYNRYGGLSGYYTLVLIKIDPY